MNLSSLLKKLQEVLLGGRNRSKSLAEYQHEMIVKIGKAQFEKLKDLGLSIPVAHL